MTAFLLGVLALATIALCFAFATLVLALQRRVPDSRDGVTPAIERQHVDGSPTGTMSRVLADIEQLASLRDRGALTEKEFAAQKAKLLVDDVRDGGRQPVRSRSR